MQKNYFKKPGVSRPVAGAPGLKSVLAAAEKILGADQRLKGESYQYKLSHSIQHLINAGLLDELVPSCMLLVCLLSLRKASDLL